MPTLPNPVPSSRCRALCHTDCYAHLAQSHPILHLQSRVSCALASVPYAGLGLQVGRVWAHADGWDVLPPTLRQWDEWPRVVLQEEPGRYNEGAWQVRFSWGLVGWG